MLVILFLGIGLISEKVFARIFIQAYFKLNSADNNSVLGEEGEKLCKIGKFNALIVKGLPSLIGLGIFAAIAFLSFTVFITIPSQFLRLFFLATLLTVTLIRLIVILSQIVFSPSVNAFRILPLETGMAKNSTAFSSGRQLT